MVDFVKVAMIGDIPTNSRKVVEKEGRSVVIFNVAGDFFAVGRNCPHEGGPLDEGTLEGRVLTCPWHGIMFDLATGKSIDGEGYSITRYELKVEGKSIFLGGPNIERGIDAS